VVEHLYQRVQDMAGAKVGLVYLYFNYRDPEPEHQAQSLLRNLLGQLTRNLPMTADTTKPFGYVQFIYDTYGHYCSVSQPTMEEVSEAFYHVAGWYDHVFVVLDALDECRSRSERGEFLSQIFTLQSKIDLRVFATSRLNEEIQGVRPSIVIQSNEEDIGVFLDGRMQELGGPMNGNPALAMEVREAIANRAKGV